MYSRGPRLRDVSWTVVGLKEVANPLLLSKNTKNKKKYVHENIGLHIVPNVKVLIIDPRQPHILLLDYN